MKRNLIASAAVALTLSAPPAFAVPGFDIVVTFLGAGDAQQSWGTGAPIDYTQVQKDAFESAAMFWESKITGYAGSISIPTFEITAALAAEDGEFNSLAYAAPGLTLMEGGFTVPTTGYMQFDADDWGPVGFTSVNDPVDDGTPFTRGELLLQEFIDSVRHEMAHALGFGTLFEDNGVASGRDYTGAEAVAAFNQQFGQNVTKILLDPAEGHWSECWRAVNDPSCIEDQAVDGATNDLELMTPEAVAAATFSDATLAAFRDIGYTTVAINAVPEPATGLLLLGALAGLGFTSRKRTA